MPAKITNFYSITFRPRDGITKVHEDIVMHLVNESRFKVKKCLATIEKDGTPGRHIQSAWVLEDPVNSQLFRKYIVKKLTEGLADDEKQHSVCVNTHHDLMGLLGYCMKEQTGPPWLNRGFSETELLVASEHYKQEKALALSTKNHKHVSQDQFYELMKEAHDSLIMEWKYHKPHESDIAPDFQIDKCVRYLLMGGYNILPHCTKGALSTLNRFWDSFVNNEERWDTLKELADEVVQDNKNIVHMYNGKTRSPQSI